MARLDEVPPEQQWTGMTIELTNAAGERFRLTPHPVVPPRRGPTLKIEMARDDDFDRARRHRPAITSEGQRLVVDVPAGYTLKLLLPPEAPSSIWACWNGYLGNGYVAVIVEADDEDAARVAAARALAEHPDGKSPFGGGEQWTTVKQVERLTLPYVCELG